MNTSSVFRFQSCQNVFLTVPHSTRSRILVWGKNERSRIEKHCNWFYKTNIFNFILFGEAEKSSTMYLWYMRRPKKLLPTDRSYDRCKTGEEHGFAKCVAVEGSGFNCWYKSNSYIDRQFVRSGEYTRAKNYSLKEKNQRILAPISLCRRNRSSESKE
jgi:hypothetical protein